jgi:hypothetical protein
MSNVAHLVPSEAVESRRAVLNRINEEMETWFRDRPLAPCSFLTGLSDWYNDWLAHPDEDAYWWDSTIALNRRGWKVVYAEDARAFTETPATLGGLGGERRAVGEPDRSGGHGGFGARAALHPGWHAGVAVSAAGRAEPA